MLHGRKCILAHFKAEDTTVTKGRPMLVRFTHPFDKMDYVNRSQNVTKIKKESNLMTF